MAANAAPELRFYFVWQDVLPSDALAAAEKHARAESDSRARHYWDVDLALGHAWAKPLATPYAGEVWSQPLAWDVVMVFAGEASWTDALPTPKLHMFPRATAAGAPAFSVDALRESLGG